MHIEFSETGGFAGLSKKFVLDSNDLSDEKKKELEALASAAKMDMPNKKSEGAADHMNYDLDIDGEKASFDDLTMNNPLRALYSFVKSEVLALKKAAKK